MTAQVNKDFAHVLRQLEKDGLLLLSGSEIPSVRGLITNKTSPGSWWSDPAAQRIFVVSELLEDHPDVTITKLVTRKVTFVHRQLWDYLFAVGTARDDWQLNALSREARAVLNEVDKHGSIRSDGPALKDKTKTGDVTRQLEQRLLVHSDQVHTETGAHAKVIETWEHWAKRVKFKAKKISVGTARSFLEKRVEEINKQFSGRGKLPWQ
jgi:hypothetical protein